MNIAVIGGGAFGTMTAIRLAEAGETVSLFERRSGLMLGTTRSANRLHRGYHYPRDEETARQCVRGYRTFCEEFRGAILPGLGNAYFIAGEGSLTTPDQFLAANRRNGLTCRTIEPDEFRPAVQNVSLGVWADEVMYDPAALRRMMVERVAAAGIGVAVGAEVVDLRRSRDGGFEISIKGGGKPHFDAVVNCAYAEMNRLTARLGHPIETRHYQYTAVPVIELDWPEPRSITVIDGPFMCLLPYDGNGQYLLYHVENSVVARSDEPLLDRNWLDPQNSPFASVDHERWYAALLDRCCEFVPALRQGRFRGVVQNPRMVFAGRADTDPRPSLVTQPEPGYVTVFSGKVAHCTWVADEVAAALGCGAGSLASNRRGRRVGQSMT